jgi:hypothetical protein
MPVRQAVNQSLRRPDSVVPIDLVHETRLPRQGDDRFGDRQLPIQYVVFQVGLVRFRRFMDG